MRQVREVRTQDKTCLCKNRNFVVLLLSILLFTLSCEQKRPVDAHTLVVALSASPKTLDPRLATDATGERLSGLIFNSLVKIGPNLEPIGDAATRWSFKDNTFTFELRPHIIFSTGAEMTDADILFTFSEYQGLRSPFKSNLSFIEKVSTDFKHEPHLVFLKLKKYSATLLTDLAVVRILPKEIAIQKGPDFYLNPIGSGSFVVDSQSPTEIVLKARHDHPFAPPKIDRVVFKIIQDDTTRFLKVIKGGIDLAQAELPLEKIGYLSTRRDLTVTKTPGLAMNYILINFKDPDLRNIALRRAIALALNRDDIIRFKLEGLAQPATALITPSNPFFSHALKSIQPDIKEAKRLVASLNLKDREFILKSSSNPQAIENSRVIARQLEEVGLRVHIQSFEWGTFYGDVKEGRFQLALMRWVGVVDPDLYRQAFHSQEFPPGRNRGFYSNPNLDPLLTEAVSEIRLEKRKEMYKKIQQMVLDDLAIIPLWYDTQVCVMHRSVKNYHVPLNGDYSGLLLVTKQTE